MIDAMMSEKHELYTNGGRPKGASVIKSEPRSISPCYGQGHEPLQSPPSVGGSNGLFNGIGPSKRPLHRHPDDWLAPRSPVPMPTNLSSSPSPALHHASMYPSTSNGYPSPGSYDPYGSSSKMSKFF